MNTSHIVHSAGWAGCGLAAALLFTAGCATPPPTVEKIASVPMGTVTTYHRKSSGSLGTFDGKVVWTHAPGSWQGKPVVAWGAPQAGVALHEPVNFGVVATLQPSGQPSMSYDPPFNFPWPLEVGKRWTTDHKVTRFPAGDSMILKVTGRVESLEEITVPAGTFKAYKLMWANSLGESETRWISPGDGIATVKRHVERRATHPLGAGVLDAELLSRVLPAK
ncbi:MAG: hypothetical protein Q8K96_11360 [Rubrivivax sp.]|nr:hypothetical protein [Rubrivivax sp.]